MSVMAYAAEWNARAMYWRWAALLSTDPGPRLALAALCESLVETYEGSLLHQIHEERRR